MTYYDLIVNGGPFYLATILTECNLKAMAAAATKVGERFGAENAMDISDFGDDARNKIIQEHYDFLMSEVKEKNDQT
jgi:hypothetical protein